MAELSAEFGGATLRTGYFGVLEAYGPDATDGRRSLEYLAF